MSPAEAKRRERRPTCPAMLRLAEAGLTLAAIAARSGVGSGTVSRSLAGLRHPFHPDLYTFLVAEIGVDAADEVRRLANPDTPVVSALGYVSVPRWAVEYVMREVDTPVLAFNSSALPGAVVALRAALAGAPEGADEPCA